MPRLAHRSGVTPAEFLAWERLQPARHEYFRGEVFAMAGGSPRHNALCSSVNEALRAALRDRGCVVFSSDQRIGLGERFVYADVTAVCGNVQLETGTTDVLVNPRVIIEVLSPSTEQYDRGKKWEGYQGLSSLQDYVLVSQSEPRVEHFQREGDGSWTYRSLESGQRVVLRAGGELDVDAIFSGMLELPGERDAPGSE